MRTNRNLFCMVALACLLGGVWFVVHISGQELTGPLKTGVDQGDQVTFLWGTNSGFVISAGFTNIIISGTVNFPAIFSNITTLAGPVTPTPALSNAVAALGFSASSSTNLLVTTNASGLFSFYRTDTAAAEVNNVTGTNAAYSVYLDTNTYTQVELSSTVHVRNGSGSQRGYRLIWQVQPTGGTVTNLKPWSSALQSGGNEPGYINGNALAVPYTVSTAVLTNGGTVTLAVELSTADAALGAQVFNFKATGIK